MSVCSEKLLFFEYFEELTIVGFIYTRIIYICCNDDSNSNNDDYNYSKDIENR